MNGDKPAPTQPAPTEPETPWQYKSTVAQPTTPAATQEALAPVSIPAAASAEATWTASEFIDHHKTPAWYATFIGLVAAFIIIVFLWTHDIVSVVAIAAMAILFGIVAGRKPRVLEYRLDGRGLTIGDAFHPYGEFKSYSVMEDGAMLSIMFLPLKRFMPPVSIYYSPEDQDKIVDVLGQHLPMEMRERDAIDRLSRRIRF